jgi:DNA-binding NtrC family response regulator
MKTGHILVVDDDESTRSLLSEYFTQLGYEVKTADDGEDALKKFIPGAFDCIISDLFMPTIDGIELLKKIRKEDQEVFFVMITGHPAIDSAVNAIKEGAFEMRMKVERALSVKKTEASLKRVKGLFMSVIILLPILTSLKERGDSSRLFNPVADSN